ncbi:hypothetical protein PHYBOEH_010993 [Phytophthora boehmeriae]|uniref:BZIP domain-containing protein n=1 Tax=Phytophthora boehmeriae TaxID=109152 RepID=A0A8T1VJA7_9STRA|nr:hypothetical protein PHYBOEH_010993 [Phytophthora boehmeriae]
MASRPSYEDSKRERRRELGRKSQTAYRERRRQIEPRLMREIYALKDEVKKLEDWKVMRDGVQGKQQTDPIQTIRDVYYAIDCRLNQQQIVDVQKYEQTHGCSPALQYLLDLQREEFDSTASLELHWSWYRTQFRVFELSVTSFERVEAAEHVIIKIKGSLCLDICCSVNKGKRAIVCPVQHLFEFEKGNQAVTRITSEVDLIGGVMARQGQGLERALFALQRLSDSFGL